MNWHANWIWTTGDPSPRNSYLCARRCFDVASDIAQASLSITADSRYVLYLNGRCLGRGPARCFPANQSYDVYHVGPRLRPGQNVLAVLVRHYGESTFQYVLGRGGLLVQLDLTWADGRTDSIASDRRWRARLHRGYAADAPRLSVQLDFEEQFDAAAATGDWTEPDYDDGDWANAVEIGRVGTKPWPRLRPRDISFLTDELVAPVNVLWARAVRPPALAAAIDYRATLAPGTRDSKIEPVEGLLATVIHADRPEKVTIRRHWACGLPLRLDGADLNVGRDDVTVPLSPGDHLLMIDVTGSHHLKQCTVVLDAQDPSGLRFGPLPGLPQDQPWATAGPFGNDQAARQAIWSCATPEDLRAHAKWLEPVPRPYFTHQPVAAVTSLQRELPQACPQVVNLSAMCAPNDDVTEIRPASDQADTELLIDFGRELVGFLDFELEAPAGAVLDFNLFEAIEDGRLHYTGHLNNALRYGTRAGWQRYTAVARRGFRYVLLTIRNPAGPVRIRRLSCVLNTYPLLERGRFHCSDPLLNEVWRLGRYTARLCSEDTFVDCPAYEQAFWVGDARNEALINYAAFGDLSLARHCWLLAAESLDYSPLVQSQVPSGWPKVLTAWSLLWVLACEEFYQYSGDLEFVRRVYPLVRKQADSIRGMLNADGLLEIEAWNMLDWAPMDTPSEGVITHQNAWLVEALRRSAVLARLLNETADAKGFEDMARALKDAINAHLWSDQHQGYIDSIHADGRRSSVISQQTNTVVYLCDAATPERQALIEQYVKDVPDGWVRIGSPFMMFFTFEALVKLGDFETVLQITRDRWGQMLDQGATTCWETFPGFDRHWLTRSHCHAWSAAPTYFLSAYQLGVRPLEPGFARALVAPVPAGLSWARGCVSTLRGELTVDWKQGAATFDLTVTCPPDVAALIRLPDSVPSSATVEVAGPACAIWSAEGWQVDSAIGSSTTIAARW